MVKKKEFNPKVQWAKFIAVLVLYLLFLYWVGSWWGLLVIPFIYDVYITKKIKWQWWKEAERPVKFVMSWIDALVFALVAVYFINQFFFQNYVIPSSSLEKSLLTGDYLFVSKVSYGPRIPQTPLTMPLTQHTLPVIECKSYIDWPHWDYRRVKGLGKVELNDIVVFNFPAGDTLCSAPQYQAYDYYQMCYGIGYQLYPNRPDPDSLSPEDRIKYFETIYEAGRNELWRNQAEYGEIITRPTDRRENYVKRCVGLPGQTLEIRNRMVYLDGKKNKEPENVQYTYHVKLTGGLRWNIYHLPGYTTSSLNPNLSLSYESYHTQLMAGYAVRHQYLLQTGFSSMGLPTEFWLSCGDGKSPQYAHEFSLTAAQYLFRRRYRISVDVFYRKLYNQVEFSGSVLDYFNTKADLNKQMLFGHGENYGFNVMLNKCSGRLTGWLSYSYTQAKRRFDALGAQRYPASHERPHEVSVVGTYSFNNHWSIGSVFVYASGTPFTAPAYVAMYNQNLLINYGEHNANRLKPYVRLDLSVNYKWRGRWIRENGINLSLYNATSRNNEIFYYVSTDEDGSFAYRATKFQLRILPSVSYFCKF